MVIVDDETVAIPRGGRIVALVIESRSMAARVVRRGEAGLNAGCGPIAVPVRHRVSGVQAAVGTILVAERRRAVVVRCPVLAQPVIDVVVADGWPTLVAIGHRVASGVFIVWRLRKNSRVDAVVQRRIEDGVVEPLADRQAGSTGSFARGIARLPSDPCYLPRNARFHARIRMLDRRGGNGTVLVGPAPVNRRWTATHSCAFGSQFLPFEVNRRLRPGLGLGSHGDGNRVWPFHHIRLAPGGGTYGPILM